MAGFVESGRGGRGSQWRIAGWGVAATLLVLPAIAMQFTDEMNWGPGDFLIFAAMLAVAGGLIELAATATVNRSYRAVIAVAVVAAFLLVWAELAVGIIGD